MGEATGSFGCRKPRTTNQLLGLRLAMWGAHICGHSFRGWRPQFQLAQWSLRHLNMKGAEGKTALLKAPAWDPKHADMSPKRARRCLAHPETCYVFYRWTCLERGYLEKNKANKGGTYKMAYKNKSKQGRQEGHLDRRGALCGRHNNSPAVPSSLKASSSFFTFSATCFDSFRLVSRERGASGSVGVRLEFPPLKPMSSPKTRDRPSGVINVETHRVPPQNKGTDPPPPRNEFLRKRPLALWRKRAWNHHRVTA